VVDKINSVTGIMTQHGLDSTRPLQILPIPQLVMQNFILSYILLGVVVFVAAGEPDAPV
jgi:hypothetical protein